MKPFWISFFLLLTSPLWSMDAQMYSWHTLLAYGEVRQVVDAGDVVYGLARNALFSVDKKSEQIQTYSKQEGLNGADIAQIGYDELSHTLLIVYTDGLMDFITQGKIYPMIDLQQKDLSSSKEANNLLIHNGLAYLSMPFGIVVVDMKDHIIKDTYYIGERSSEVNVIGVALSADSIFAISTNVLYSASLTANLVDYAYWNHTATLPKDSLYMGIAVWQDELCVVAKNCFSQRKQGRWVSDYIGCYFTGMRAINGQCYLLTRGTGVYYLNNQGAIACTPMPYSAQDVVRNGDTYWLATSDQGIVRVNADGGQSFQVDGPTVNIPYRLKIANQKLYMVPGARWATQEKREANIMIYDMATETWTNITSAQIMEQTGADMLDLMNVAVDPLDPEHFFVTSYGCGLLECQGNRVIHWYHINNSPLETAAAGSSAMKYTRLDGAIFDAEGNLWLLNAGVESAVHVATPQQIQNAHTQAVAQWTKMQLKNAAGRVIVVHTPQEMLVDNRYANWKWIPYARAETGLILLDDHGTPFNVRDDQVVQRTSFTDQDGKVVNLLDDADNAVYAVAQDKDGTLWIALKTGLITIPSNVDFKQSDRCERIKIARNDGTNLADYLLNTERINAIAVDGANRKWFGTAGSGLYLMSADGQETLEHFTTDDSPLLSNEILSLAIEPNTGKVFIGTSKGLMAYQSDAASPFDSYSSAYAYPNPIRPDYDGPITITGLMDESVVHIVDHAGCLVCETRSNGGLAIWDGRTGDGRRVASGVYNVLCNDASGQHTVVKILVMH